MFSVQEQYHKLVIYDLLKIVLTIFSHLKRPVSFVQVWFMIGLLFEVIKKCMIQGIIYVSFMTALGFNPDAYDIFPDSFPIGTAIASEILPIGLQQFPDPSDWFRSPLR